MTPVALISPPLEYSAATLYTLNLASALLAKGLAVRVVTPGGRFLATFRARGIEVVPVPALASGLRRPFALRRLARVLKDGGTGLLHAQGAISAEWAAHLAARMDAPAVLTVHRFYDPAWPVDVDWRPFGAIIVLGEKMREDVVNRRHAPKDRVHLIAPGVAEGLDPRPVFERAGAAARAGGVVPIVGTLGEVDSEEVQALFVRAAAVVRKSVPEAQFLIVGEGAAPRALRALIRETGMSASVTFTNVIDQQKALPEIDVCVMPSVKEGAGHAILEAMAAARPVIAAGAGGAYEVIADEETGLLVEEEREDALAAAILRLVTDRDLARRLGARAREVVLERFPLDRMVRETIAVYERMLEA